MYIVYWDQNQVFNDKEREKYLFVGVLESVQREFFVIGNRWELKFL